MSRCLLLVALVGLAAGCQTTATTAPVVERVTVRCPTEPPPDIPALPGRPADMRNLAPDRLRIEGIHAGIVIRQSAYRAAWDTCPDGLD